ncbi:hypothetical protein SEA_MCKLOVIN_71 [Gordonia phage Mcklovin]|uniref:Uncharacterized protein n=1 Tax=Gordonia phage Mcklovin TaxID=2652881 RepID=A0A5P8DCY3_9CAUD|nr:hypothetical protein PP514_gp71 [Gordonia phage Mcklovin]QFP96856.1 hypothetical protein SEA_MCKLOVIN_71 [Gordonia phage Mcklovin]
MTDDELTSRLARELCRLVWDIDDWLGLDDGDKELWLDVARQLRAEGWKR